MSKTILLTSFTTWKPDQITNSSDDLLLEMLQHNPPAAMHFLRQLPVDFELAPQQAIAHINQLKPDVILCCGMAESRNMLNVESRAIVSDRMLQTSIDLDSLIAGLANTEISHDAGNFVCNTLYYALLKHIQEQCLPSSCLFIHVPILTPENRAAIIKDFQHILERVGFPIIDQINQADRETVKR